jgi:hypothetical protein
MPEWARSTFQDFLDHTEILAQLLELTIGSISTVPNMPELVRALAVLESPVGSGNLLSPEASARIEAADRRAKLAQREIESDFNLLHSQAVTSLWSGLEDVVRTFVARWLLNLPTTRTGSPWAELKVKVGEYEQLDDEQKAYHLVELIEQTTAASLKRGVNRFECLLDGLGLSGPLSEDLRDAIFEMKQVRNIIAHRRGIADRRFCQFCPDFQLAPGKMVLVSHKMWHKYFGAAHGYILEIVFRTGEKFGDVEIRDRTRRATGACPVLLEPHDDRSPCPPGSDGE